MSEPITNTADAVRELGALPVPVGPERRTLDKVEDELTGANLSLYEEELTSARLRLALASAQRGRRELRAELKYTEASRERWRTAAIEERDELRRQLESARVDGARLIHAERRRAELEAVLATHRKDDQAEIERLRAQVAALLAERHETNEALDDAVQELRAREGRSADRLTRMLAPTQALREVGACTECGDGPSVWCPGCAKCSCVAEHDMGCARRAGGPR